MELRSLEAWFITGSQNLYGPQVARTGGRQQPANGRGAERFGPTAGPRGLQARGHNARGDLASLPRGQRRAELRRADLLDAHLLAGQDVDCRPSALDKPMAHLHTQFNRDLPWAMIDMDFMNLNQAAHGDREFGYICTRLGKARKVIVGHWQDPEAQDRLAVWMRAAAGVHELRRLKVARLGDNMRQVAVTEGDKVEAQIRFGMEVNGFALTELVRRVEEATDAQIDRLVAEYDGQYAVAAELRPGGPRRESLRYEARIELGLRAFLESGPFHAFTDTFEDLAALKQLPGLAVQRLMADGYGFGAEGDWKTAALVRAMKVMAAGSSGGASFMEDYTYHLDPKGPKVLGAHMLEICPSLAADRPSCEIHPLGIGGKSDPVRLVFTARPGPAVNVALIDLGDRFRLLVNEVDAVEPEQPLPRLPVARAFWTPRPDLKTAAAAWIYAGGPHHMAFSQAFGSEHIEDFAEMAGVECVRDRQPDAAARHQERTPLERGGLR